MMTLSQHQRERLLAVAQDSIRYGLTKGKPLQPSDDDATLQQPGASFVTLNLNGQLRGCIGSLQPHRALIQDIADNAFNAAFRDPRFPPVSVNEIGELDLHLSILSPTEPISFSSEADLLRQLRPGIDGLVLTDGHHRGTFLPQVWEQLPMPVDFLAQLKRKAGLPPDHWSPTLCIERYSVIPIP